MDFKTTVNKLKTDEERLKHQEKIKSEDKRRYRQEIIGQMTEKERKKKEEEAEAKKAFQATIEAEKNREKYVEEKKSNKSSSFSFLFFHLKLYLSNRLVKNVIAIKIKQMKETNIPERFVKDVQKQLKVTVN